MHASLVETSAKCFEYNLQADIANGNTIKRHGGPSPTSSRSKNVRKSCLTHQLGGHELVMGSVPQFLTTVASSMPSIMPTASKVIADRNVQNVVLGDIFFKTWYPSFYPEELVGRDTERLYVCRWCFKYSKELMPFSAHVVSSPGQTLYALSSCA